MVMAEYVEFENEVVLNDDKCDGFIDTGYL